MLSFHKPASAAKSASRESRSSTAAARRCNAARVLDNRSSTRPAVTDRYSRTVVASVSRMPISRAIASVVSASSPVSSAASSPIGASESSPADSSSAGGLTRRIARVIRCIRIDQRPPSSDTRPGSCSMRELMAPIVRAIASARSEARFVQNSASAARVGTDRA